MKARGPRLGARDWGLAAAAIALLVDQGSKILLLYALNFRDMPGKHLQILPFFNLVMVWNRGISYGLLPAHGRIGTVLLAVFSALAVAGLGWWLWNARRTALAIGLGLVIGGALGNLIDRLVYGKVADFFHFYAGRYDWYVFNMADCAITVGVVTLLYDALLRSEPAAQKGKLE
ncbi:MAG: signal peptidase II [Rhizomicrobium sp.]